MSEDLEQDIRKKMCDLISKNPGLHLSKIAESFKMRISLAEYHLNYLTKNKVIFSVKNPGEYYRRYYIKDTPLGVDDKKILAILREETLFKIVLLFLRKERLRNKDIVKHFNVSPPTITYYLHKLLANEIIEEAAQGEERGYVLRNRKRIIRLLFAYELHVVADDFKAIWDELQYWRKD